MAGKGGVITRKDMFSDDAMKFGEDYAKQLNAAIAANKVLVDSVKELNKQVQAFKVANSQKDYITAKQAEALATQQAIDSIKKKEAAELSLNKIERSRIATMEAERKAIEASEKATQRANTEKERSKKLTIEERVQNEINNKLLKQEALERLGLVSAYTKLNAARTEAKNKLRDLIASEGASIEEIKRAQKEYDNLEAKVRKADHAVNDFTKNVGNYPQLTSMTSVLKDLVGAFGLLAGVDAFASVVKYAWKTVKDFNQSIADLSAITGATGPDLDYLKEKAIELGKETKGGASAVVEAYKLIGSAKPELLSNVEALNQVTESVLTLAKASGMEMPAAATALTDAMNQFGADASQAAKFVDTLAAGAKYGAAEIPQVTDALLKFGAVARTSNVNIQESTALVELLAENGLKGAEAGTALRNVMLKLNAPDALPKEARKAIEKLGISFSDLSDTSKPIQERLEKLKPLLKDNAGMVKVFGLENVVAATNILGHTDRLKVLTKQVDENGVAQEQATIRSNTLTGATDRLSSAWDSYILSQSEATNTTGFLTKTLSYLGDNLETIINTVVKLGAIYLTYLVTTKAITYATEAYRAIKVAITAAEIAFTNATGIGTIAMKAQALATKQAEAAEIARMAEKRIAILVTQGLTIAEAEAVVATEALNIATKATPWGLILGLLAAAVAGYIAFSDSLSEAEKATKRLKDESKRYTDQEASTNKNDDEFRAKRFKQIDDEIRLRGKKGEDSKKLDDEEIKSKQEILKNEIDIYIQTKDSEESQTKTLISESNKRISQMQKEIKQGKLNRLETDKEGDVTAISNQKQIDIEKEANTSRLNRIKDINAAKTAQATKLNNTLSELNKKAIENEAQQNNELTKDQIAKAKKAREDYLKNLKDRDKQEFELGQFRLQRAKELNQEIVDNEKKSIDERIESYLSINQLDIELSENTATQKLKEISRYDDKVRDLTDKQIEQLIKVSESDKKALYKKLNLNNEEILALEQLQAKKEDINKKTEKNRQDLIDKEVGLIKKKTDLAIQAQEKEINEAIFAEQTKFKALSEGHKVTKDEIEEHERQVLEIKKIYVKKALDIQIKSIEDLLLLDKAKDKDHKISTEARTKLEEDLAKLRVLLGDEVVKEETKNYEDLKKLEEEALERRNKAISEISASIGKTFAVLNNGFGLDSTKLESFFKSIASNFDKIKTDGKLSFESISESAELAIGVISDISNSLSQSRIATIDAEISKNDEYYNKQLELAGNDARKKDSIQKEAEKKRQELEKKKRAEQHKQAVFNKTMAIIEAGINTAKAVTAALSAGPGVGLVLAVITAAAAAVQLAAIVASPIPKYKDGRKGGIAELAFVGDGGVSEVIERRSGGIEITPATDTLVKLNAGDKVHSSVEEYLRLQKSVMMSGIRTEGRKMSDFQANQSFDNVYSKETLSVMKETLRAIKNQKNGTVVNVPKLDINHHLWKIGNTNWG